MRGTDYVLKRVAFAIVTVFVAVTINFVLFRLAPGTAVTNLSRVPHATQQLRHALEVQFGLDKSKWQQYVIYLKQLAHGNLGISYENQQPVSTNLRIALINTLPMVTLGTVFAIVFGIFTGVIAAWRRRTKTEGLTVSTALALLRDAHAMARADADHHLRRGPADRRDDERVPAQPAVLDAREGSRVAHVPAGVDARAHAVRGVHAHRALGDARDARRGLHPHRPRERAEAARRS